MKINLPTGWVIECASKGAFIEMLCKEVKVIAIESSGTTITVSDANHRSYSGLVRTRKGTKFFYNQTTNSSSAVGTTANGTLLLHNGVVFLPNQQYWGEIEFWTIKEMREAIIRYNALKSLEYLRESIDAIKEDGLLKEYPALLHMGAFRKSMGSLQKQLEKEKNRMINLSI